MHQAGRAGERRRAIFKALHACVIEQGYSKTTLADVARTADMSPSHLLYYFPGLDSILQHYFSYIIERIILRMGSFRHEPADRKIDLLAELFFGGSSEDKSEIGFMLECFGVAVHDKELQREKIGVDQFCKTYLQELFEPTASNKIEARNSAEVAYALLVGLRTASYFDESLSPKRARSVFREEMLARARPAPSEVTP
ncbi:MAG: TetR/AcrR family transcriptional regulator [Pseudomonadota bacterium]